MIEISAIQCPECKDIVFSRARHDCNDCSCGKCYIDGGFEYVRVGWRTEKGPRHLTLKIDATKQQLYDDWNYQTNQFGRLTPEQYEKLPQ